MATPNPSLVERKERWARKMAAKEKPPVRLGRSTERLPPGQHLTQGFPILDLGIKPEIVQGAEANRICRLILRKRFTVPAYGITRLSDSPGHAAIALATRDIVVCPSRFLRRRVESDVTNIGPST